MFLHVGQGGLGEFFRCQGIAGILMHLNRQHDKIHVIRMIVYHAIHPGQRPGGLPEAIADHRFQDVIIFGFIVGRLGQFPGAGQIGQRLLKKAFFHRQFHQPIDRIPESRPFGQGGTELLLRFSQAPGAHQGLPFAVVGIGFIRRHLAVFVEIFDC